MKFTQRYAISLLLATCFTTSVADSNIVQHENQMTRLTCKAPSDWVSCSFKHEETEKQCGARKSGGKVDCKNGYYIDAEEHRCTMWINSVSKQDNGTWTCSFLTSKMPNGWIHHGSQFLLTVITEPSSIEWYPVPNDDRIPYNLSKPLEISLIVRNVRPKPKVTWTMNNSSIEGFFVASNTIIEEFEYLTIQETLLMTGRESYDGQSLEYLVELYSVDEDGNSVVEYSSGGNVDLKCIGCDSRTSTTPPPTTAITTTAITTTKTTSTTLTSATTTATSTTTATCR